MRPGVTPFAKERSWMGRGGRHLVLGALLILAASPGWARGQAADDPAAKAGAVPLARYAPREGLAVYVEFDGFDAHDAAWKASAAYKVLNETKLGAVFEDVFTQLVVASQAPVQPGDLIGAFKMVARQGFAVGVWGKDPGDLYTVTVIRGGGRPEVRRLFEMITRVGRGAPADENAGEKKAGRTIQALGDQTSYWYEKDDLVVTSQPDAILAVLDGKEPNAIDHPMRQALLKAEAGFQPVAVAFVEFAGLPKMPPQAVRLGLDGIKRLELVWGFEGEAMRTAIRATAPAPRRGVLALVDQPTFDAQSLPPIPAGVHGFIVLSLDVPKTYDAILGLYKMAGPGEGAPDLGAMIEDGVRQQFGFDLRKDLIAGLGPKVTFYMQEPAGKAGAQGSRAAAMINRLSGITLTADVRDATALSRAIDPVVTMFNGIIGQAPGAGGLAFKKEEGARPRYVMNIPEGMLPPPFSTLFRPTVILGQGQLVVAASTAAADRVAGLSAAKAEGRWQADSAYDPVMRRLPSKLVYLRISDPRELLPAIVDALPVLAQTINQQVAAQRRQFQGGPGAPVLKIEADSLPRAEDLIPRLFPASTALVVDDQGASLITREPIPGLTSPVIAGLYGSLLTPAVFASRSAAHRAQCTNNLKQIGLAHHNYISANNTFPMAAIADKDGKPLLSWRVAILPYIEQQELYNKFKLDEPWDSPNNKPLIQEMPATYLCPDRKNPEAGTTTYRMFVGTGALSEEGQATGLANITDGTSNTILVVESKDAVTWTKPDDLKFDPEAKPSLFGAGSLHPGGFNALFADGSVHFIKNTIKLEVWKALITRAGGEVIAADQY
jgi:prepilin-type processing-associated H-X9-DG protein